MRLWYLLRVFLKISNKHPRQFFWGVPPPPPPPVVPTQLLLHSSTTKLQTLQFFNWVNLSFEEDFCVNRENQ